MPGNFSFQNVCLKEFEFKAWLSADPNKHHAYCKLCRKSFDISSMGKTAVKSHNKGIKHLERLADVQRSQQQDILGFGQCIRSSPDSTAPMTVQASNTTTFTNSSLNLFITKNDLLTAELWWCLKLVDSNVSCQSSVNIGFVLRQMFPNSYIAKQFTCTQTKAMYLICFGLLVCFKKSLIDKILHSDGYVLMFDETLNRELQKKQMDLLIRLWEQDEIHTRYFNSQFMGHAAAVDILKVFESSIKDILAYKSLIQLSMDGPNINICVCNDLNEEIKDGHNVHLLNIGSCGLHKCNNAYRTGVVASGWNISMFLRSLFIICHDVPAYRDDYVKVTGSQRFPFKHCLTGCVENACVAYRAIEIVPSIKKYIEAVKSGKVHNPGTKSFDIVMDYCKDNLLTAKLACFSSIAKIIGTIFDKIPD